MQQQTELTRNISAPNKALAMLIGFIYGAINGGIRFALTMGTVAVLILPVFILSVATSASFFYKQKNYNPVAALLQGLISGLMLTYYQLASSIFAVYAAIAKPFLGIRYGFKNGLLVTLKDYTLEIINHPGQIIKAVKYYFSKFVTLFNTVNLPQTQYTNLIIALNDESHNTTIAKIREYFDPIIQRARDDNATDTVAQFVDLRNDIIFYLTQRHLDSRTNTSVFHAFNSFMVKNSLEVIDIDNLRSLFIQEMEQDLSYQTDRYVHTPAQRNQHQPSQTHRNWVFYDGSRTRSQQAPDIELKGGDVSSYKISKSDQLDEEFLAQKEDSHPELVSRYKATLQKLREDECAILSSVPSEDEKIVLFRQYLDGQQWKNVKAETYIFSKPSLESWFRINRSNPLVPRSSIDYPAPHEDKQTRVRYCKVHGTGGDLYCPELREVIDALNGPAPEERVESTAQHEKDNTGRNPFTHGERSPASSPGSSVANMRLLRAKDTRESHEKPVNDRGSLSSNNLG